MIWFYQDNKLINQIVHGAEFNGKQVVKCQNAYRHGIDLETKAHVKRKSILVHYSLEPSP